MSRLKLEWLVGFASICCLLGAAGIDVPSQVAARELATVFGALCSNCASSTCSGTSECIGDLTWSYWTGATMAIADGSAESGWDTVQLDTPVDCACSQSCTTEGCTDCGEPACGPADSECRTGDIVCPET